jgi:hypothetical protein
MRIAKTAGLIVAVMLAILPASAQTNETLTREELAWKFVQSGNQSPGDMVIAAQDSVLEVLQESAARLRPDVREWMAVSFSLAAREVTKELVPVIEQKLYDAYVSRFSAEDLRKVLAFQEFVLAPERAAALTASQNGETAAARMKILQERLPPEDFQHIMQTTLNPPMINVTLTTLEVSRGLVADYKARFEEEVLKYCGNAPKGVLMCEKQGRPQ